MVLAVCALYSSGVTTLRNIGSWRIKETDRILAIRQGLEQLGGKVERGRQLAKNFPPKKLKSARINTYNDHRIAMTFSLASFRHPGDKKKK